MAHRVAVASFKAGTAGPAEGGCALIRVLIADDHAVFRMGLKTMLRSEADLQLAGEAHSGTATVTAFQQLRPDVTVLDLRMPEGGGMHALRGILAADPEARVLILSSYAAEEEVYAAVRDGARGYVTKDADQPDLVTAIRALHGGGRYLPAHIAHLLTQRAPRPDLTPRELEVLELLAGGMMNRQIARTLGMSESTVRNHTIHLFSKLDVSDRTEAATFALQRGILPY